MTTQTEAFSHTDDADAAAADPLNILRRFTYTRLLNEDTQSRSVALLGTYASPDGPDVPAILHVERLNFEISSLHQLVSSLSDAKQLLINDIYHLFLAWSGSGEGVPADLKLTLTQPATEVHIRKASSQTYRMVRETPAMYESIVRPYIQSFPPERLNWVHNILSHKKESENIVFEDPDPVNGFLILPDLKWDQTNASMLYLQCIVHTRGITCIRDLTPDHLPMLRNIRRQSARAAQSKYKVEPGQLRMFAHYQPSFYHFHIHIVHISCHGYAGSTIGQAHLLDTIIDNLELDLQEPDYATRPSYYARRTLAYGLGEQHGLFPALWAATQESESVLTT